MYDFLIIGGGIAGCATAARLADLGSVLLLEAEDGLGYHASGRSAAMFEENYGSPSTVALNRASRAYLEAAGVLSARGLLMVALGDEIPAFEDSLDDLGMEEIALTAARDLVPILHDDVVRASYHADAWDIDTDLLLQGFARTARQAGAEIRVKSPVDAISKSTQGWSVAVGEETFEGRILINAAGAWVDQVAQMAGLSPLGFVPHRRSMARVSAPGGRDISLWPMLFGPGETWYAKPDAGKLLVSPADETPVEAHDAWAEDLTLAEGIARYEAHVAEPVTRLEHSWAGLRTFAPDRSLVIGFDAHDPTFFWCAGQGGYGMQSSPGYSLLAADLISGRAPELDAGAVQALDPVRFR
ncbi:MAG: FAD-dependent oxidoreductase [Pseudomonadota bacterium]